MKKYTNPELMIVTLSEEDVIKTSGFELKENHGGDVCSWDELIK